MLKLLQNVGYVLIFFTAGLTSCVNLKHVNDFSSTSLNSLKKFEEINYSFKQNCFDNCQNIKIQNLNLNSDECDCASNVKADSITLIIYSSLRGYLDGLTKLSKNDVTNYKMDAFTTALTEGNFGAITVQKEQVEAYSKISTILLKAFTNEYRKKKIKTYVKEANEPLKVLITFLNFNLSANLVGKLNVQKERIKSYYFDLTKDQSLSILEKTKSAEEYYNQLGKIESKQNEIKAYVKAIKKIADGHQKLTENIEQMRSVEVKQLLIQYASEIQDIISEFNKAKQ